MGISRYLAMTAAEMATFSVMEGWSAAYMACHFSPGGQSLSNLPERLPTGTMLILDDSTPMDGHDPSLILNQLTEIITRNNCESLLLDFQRWDIPGQQELTKLLTEALPCPVGVSEPYARELSCPVFLPPVPPDRLVSEYLGSWQGREIWLEAALDGLTYTVTEKGSVSDLLLHIPENGLIEPDLCCHYQIAELKNRVEFHLYRTADDLSSLLQKAKSHGVTTAVGLYQELGNIKL
jgi:hypothetical protein